MNRIGWLTAAVLAAALALILLALVRETGSGPTFRAEDYDSYEECMRSIPTEWGPGTLARSGAEDACFYVHRR
jgi:hypothetical protein